jgi:type IV secretion system protein TrbE
VLNLRRMLRNHRRAARGFSELVPWMLLVSPQLVLDKDGALLAVFELQGVDAEGALPSEVDRQVRLLEQALRSLDARCAVWWIVDRRRGDAYPEHAYPDPVSAHLDALWGDAYRRAAQYVNRHALAVTYAPPDRAAGLWHGLQYGRSGSSGGIGRSSGATPASDPDATLAQRIDRRLRGLSRRASFAWTAARIDADCLRFEDLLRALTETLADLGLRRLAAEALLGWLHDRASPASEGQPVRLPDPPCYLDAWLPDNTLTVEADRLCFEHIERVQIAALSVKAWPGATWPGALDSLLRVPGELSLVLALRIEQAEPAAARIRDAERHHRNLQKTFSGYLKEAITREESALIDEGRLRLAEDAGQALAHLSAEGGVFGHCALVVLPRGRSAPELEAVTREAAGRLRRLGFLLVRERLNLLGAFSVSLPGQWALSPRWHFLTTANCADLAPVRSLATGLPWNAHLTRQTGHLQPVLARLPTDAMTPLYFDLHVGDVGHALVLGPSGSGKSVLMNFLIAQSRKHPGAQVFIFDKNHSCRIATLLQGGAHVDIGSEDGAVRLNPLRLLADVARRPWLVNWLELLLTSRGHAMTSDDDRALSEALDLLAAQPAGRWRLRSLVPLLPQRLGEALAAWVGDAPLARHFDHAEDTFSLSAFTCIEIGQLFHTPRLAAAFLDYAFHRIEHALDGRPAILYIEEAWFMLAEPRFCARLNDWLRTLRKKNAAVVLATQSLDEIESSPIFASVVDNIPTRIYLANPNAGAHRRLYLERFALNETQLARIQQAVPKRDYYVTQPGVSRMVSCVFPPRLLAALRSDPQAQQAFLRHYQRRAPRWAFDYLDQFTAAADMRATDARKTDVQATDVWATDAPVPEAVMPDLPVNMPATGQGRGR